MGHAYSALIADQRATASGGTFLVRIEDIDQSRARPQWEAQIFEDLAWLGLHWPTPVRRQSEHMNEYRQAIENLWERQLLYRCDCNRRDIQEAAQAPQEGAPLIGPDGVIYPGTCRDAHPRTGPCPHGHALRLDMARALEEIGPDLSYHETAGEIGTVSVLRPDIGIGDIVLARRDMDTSYHLSVVIDDAAQSITEVVRGADLADATGIHVVLQRLLGLSTPTYHHHRLIRDEAGKRLAKRDDARAIAKYRADGATSDDIRDMIGLPAR